MTLVNSQFVNLCLSLSAQLVVTERMVGKLIANIFIKLDVPLLGDENQSSLAVLAYLYH